MKIRTYLFFKKLITPDLKKVSKSLNFFKKKILFETTKKVLILVPNTISGNFGEFQAHIMKIRTWSILKKIMALDLQKK